MQLKKCENYFTKVLCPAHWQNLSENVRGKVKNHQSQLNFKIFFSFLSFLTLFVPCILTEIPFTCHHTHISYIKGHILHCNSQLIIQGQYPLRIEGKIRCFSAKQKLQYINIQLFNHNEWRNHKRYYHFIIFIYGIFFKKSLYHLNHKLRNLNVDTSCMNAVI